MRRGPVTIVDGLFRVLAVIGFILACIALFTGEVPQSILAISLSLLALSATVVAFLLLRRLHEVEAQARLSTRWAARLAELSDIVLMIANAATQNHAKVHNTDFQPFAATACQRLASAFDSVTGAACRVSIKELYTTEGADGAPALAVRTLAMSSRGEPAGEHPDWVSDNSDFASILSGSVPRFLSNDLVADLVTGYRNSHWTPERLKEWARTGRYPYRSAIVWPIRAQVEPATAKQRWSTIGFLCVDSAETAAFDPKLDIDVGEIVAHALYCVWPHTRTDDDSENDV